MGQESGHGLAGCLSLGVTHQAAVISGMNGDDPLSSSLIWLQAGVRFFLALCWKHELFATWVISNKVVCFPKTEEKRGREDESHSQQGWGVVMGTTDI